jgi:hypothetical protein
MNFRIALQPSSFAGYAGVGATILSTVASNSGNLPNNAFGWITLALTVVSSIAAIKIDDGSGHKPAP